MAFFDWNFDGKKDFLDTMLEYEAYRRTVGDLSEDNRQAWREDAYDGESYGIYPEDYDSEEEYEEALAEAKENDSDFFVESASFEDDEAGLTEVKKGKYPNKRRYNAACVLADNFYVDSDYAKRERAACKFIVENADKILAANYLSHDGGFLYAQAIKDNFELPCSLPDEDEKPEMPFDEILLKLAKRDGPLSIKVWNWCLEQFGPYVQYSAYDGKELVKYVFDHFYYFSSIENFKSAAVHYMEENNDFLYTLISLSGEYNYSISELIATAIMENLYDTANTLFKAAFEMASGDWKAINALAENTISCCSDGEQVEAVEYFRDNMFPLIKTVPDGMVQDEIPEFEQEMSDYIDRVVDSNEKYAYSRKNAWRNTVPDGKPYNLDPRYYSSKQEYLDDLNEAKYRWRSWYDTHNNEGLDVNDYETHEDFKEALNAKRREQYETRRKAADIERAALREETVKDKTVYNFCNVLLPEYSKAFTYRYDDIPITLGDTVIIPFGINDEAREGVIVSIGQYLRAGVSCPVEKIKKIIRVKDE